MLYPTMSLKTEQTSENTTEKEKKTGKREFTGLITDVLSRYSSSTTTITTTATNNKKQKLESEQSAVEALNVLRSGRSEGSDSEDEKPRTACARSAVDTPTTEIRDGSESRKSKDISIDDFIDIEKAQYTFPERLMELLMNGSVKKAMWWLPGGEAFALVPNTFYDVVLAKYFQGTKFESFTRKLNRWGFKRLSGQGVPRGTIAYYHMLFKKENPELLKKMRSGKSGQQNNEPEPQLLGGGGLPALGPSVTNSLPSFLAASQLSNEDTAVSRFGQHPIISHGDVAGDTALRLQLLAAQHHSQNARLPPQQQTYQVGQDHASLAAIRQLLLQEQQANALAQHLCAANNSSELSLRRQAELLALEELRTVQAREAAEQMQQAQLRARLMQLQQAAASPPATLQFTAQSTAPYAAPGSGITEDQIRLFLLQRQLNNRQGGGGFGPL
ncbi:hypothetical protein ACA910_017987 [Epithemia clementina (nom. ined.)]